MSVQDSGLDLSGLTFESLMVESYNITFRASGVAGGCFGCVHTALGKSLPFFHVGLFYKFVCLKRKVNVLLFR